MSQKNNNELPKQAAENTLNLNPVIGIRGKDLLTSARMVLLQAVRQPLHSARHVAHFSLELKNVLLGQSELRPGDDDRRFSDPAWSQNPLYKRYMQTYLAWRKELHSWISHSDLSPQDISRGQFVINLLTEAMSPTNSLSNPAAVKRFFETGGKSLLDGLGHLAKDLVNNGGMPSQVDMDAFEVGKNLATTEGAVVFRNDVLELIQYRPITESVHERPLLVVPPQINKFYVFDLSPDKSLARFCLRNGVQTFIVSWRNLTKSQREWGLTSYIEALKGGHRGSPVDHRQQGPQPPRRLLRRDHHRDPGRPLRGQRREEGQRLHPTGQRARLRTEYPGRAVRRREDPGGRQASLLPVRRAGGQGHGQGVRLDAPQRPDLELLGQQLPARQPAAGVRHPLLEQRHHAPARRAARRVRRTVQEQPAEPPRRPGGLRHAHRPEAGDLRLLLCRRSERPHHPWESCYKSARLLGGKCEFILSNSGHIQSILNPPGNPKARFMTNPELPAEPKAWLEQAGKHADSWWLHWQQWLAERSGKTRKAPASLGNKTYPAGEAAPGTYVHER